MEEEERIGGEERYPGGISENWDFRVYPKERRDHETISLKDISETERIRCLDTFRIVFSSSFPGVGFIRQLLQHTMSPPWKVLGVLVFILGRTAFGSTHDQSEATSKMGRIKTKSDIMMSSKGLGTGQCREVQNATGSAFTRVRLCRWLPQCE